MQVIYLGNNQFTALKVLWLNDNLLTGDAEALRGCAELQELYLVGNQLHLTDEDRAHFTKLCGRIHEPHRFRI